MPEFNGFSTEFFSFFENLKSNNCKEWFENHREDYDEFVLRPARDFVEELGGKLRKIAPKVHAIPKINKSLLYNGLTARVEEKVPDAFYSDVIIDHAYGHYQNMLPLHQWLKKATA